MSKNVVYAILHTALFVPGAAQVGPTLDLKAGSRVTKMTLIDNFLEVTIKGTITKTVLTPLTNVVLVEIEPEKAKLSTVK